MSIAWPQFAFLAASFCLQAAVPCAPADERNGSALCISLAIVKGAIVPQDFTFSAAAALKQFDGAQFFSLAKKQFAALARPCDPLLAHGPLSQPDFCSEDSDWSAFTAKFLAHGAAVGRSQQAALLLSEAGVFRPLVIAYHRTPLLWSEVDAEAGLVVFRIPDPLDPRTSNTFQIEIRGLANDDLRNRRIVSIRQALAPLRNTIFCHDRIRARVQSLYKRLAIPIDIVQLDPQGPLLIIQENP